MFNGHPSRIVRALNLGAFRGLPGSPWVAGWWRNPDKTETTWVNDKGEAFTLWTPCSVQGFYEGRDANVTLMAQNSPKYFSYRLRLGAPVDDYYDIDDILEELAEKLVVSYFKNRIEK